MYAEANVTLADQLRTSLSGTKGIYFIGFCLFSCVALIIAAYLGVWEEKEVSKEKNEAAQEQPSFFSFGAPVPPGKGPDDDDKKEKKRK